VTDNTANVKDLLWLGCSGHNLNLVLSHVLKDVRDPVQQGDISEVLQQISVCKGIVGHVKQTHIQAKLDTTLKQAVSTRWNSNLTKKFADEFVDETLQRSLLDVNIELLKLVISVLEHFESATQLLSIDRSQSLHLVYATKV